MALGVQRSAVQSTEYGKYNASLTTPSGTNAASGQVGAFSGPFFVEEQDLTVEYTRVPMGDLDNHAITLSGVTENYSIQNTNMVVRVTASYSVTKDFNQYETSGWIEPQKFTVYSASSDVSGNGYFEGALSGNPSGTLGPRGTIVSTQKWYNRRPWDAYGTGTDSEVTQTVTDVFSTAFVKRELGSSSITTKNALSNWQTFKRYLIDPDGEGDPLGCEDTHAWYTEVLIPKQGPYSYTQENISDVPALLNKVGQRLRMSDYFAALPTNSWTIGAWAGYPIADQSVRKYHENRHDYT